MDASNEREIFANLWMGSWSGGDVLGVGLVGLTPFLWLAVDEDGSGSDEGNQLGRVDSSLSLLGAVDEFVGHGRGGLAAAVGVLLLPRLGSTAGSSMGIGRRRIRRTPRVWERNHPSTNPADTTPAAPRSPWGNDACIGAGSPG